MGGSPDFFTFGFIRRKEGGMDGLADLDNRPIDTLAEAGFVANFLQKCGIADKHDLCAESINFEYRTLLVSQILLRARVMSAYPI